MLSEQVSTELQEEKLLFEQECVNNCQFLSPPGIKVLVSSFLRLVFSYIGLVKSETA